MYSKVPYRHNSKAHNTLEIDLGLDTVQAAYSDDFFPGLLKMTEDTDFVNVYSKAQKSSISAARNKITDQTAEPILSFKLKM